jgi:hypothetical protein
MSADILPAVNILPGAAASQKQEITDPLISMINQISLCLEGRGLVVIKQGTDNESVPHLPLFAQFSILFNRLEE